MAFQLKGVKAELLKEGCELDADIKAKAVRLKEIKEELNLKAGTYTNDGGNIVIITESKEYTDINPTELFHFMKKQKMLAAFLGCIKVGITELKKVLEPDEIDQFRKEKGTSSRYSFK